MINNNVPETQEEPVPPAAIPTPEEVEELLAEDEEIDGKDLPF